MTEAAQTGFRQFGHYLLEQEIAKGGMSRVFLARLRGLGGFEKTLVVKQVLPELAGDARFVRMFVEEAKTLVRMSHPHIVPVYELGIVDGVYFLAMEHIQGATLSEILRDRELAPALTAHLGVHVCEALQYAHDQFDLVHRDVTPRNVMVDARGHVRLLDFGIAAKAGDGSPEGVFGSPGYMSPEQARGVPVGPRSDLFSLGAILFESLTARRAFWKGSPEDTKRALLGGETPSFRPGDEVPEQIAEIVAGLLETDLERRTGSAGLAARGLRTWLAANHPAGVGPALGQRATAAVAAREQQPVPLSSGNVQAAGPGDVESIATSVTLSAMLEQPPAPGALAQPGTVPIAGRGPGAGRTGAWRAVLIGTALLVAALGGWAALPPRAIAPAGEPRSVDRDAEALPAPAFDPHPDPDPSPDRSSEEHERAGARAHGWVTINAEPWAEVRIDGSSIGNTPVRRLRLRVGEHTLNLHNPPTGRSARVTLRINDGEAVRVLVDLTRDPPHMRTW